jgi:hypothetical protein
MAYRKRVLAPTEVTSFAAGFLAAKIKRMAGIALKSNELQLFY